MSNNSEQTKQKLADRPICGIIRPIAEMGSYTASHWRDVAAILEDAADDAKYRARLVSESDASGVILSEIVKNLYNDPIIIADVSGRNPNVMFELGMRLAFEKPIIIVTDDETPFSFDISPVRHIIYPRSLRYADIISFKQELSLAISATLEISKNPDHRGYLQQFGPIEVTNLGPNTIDVNNIAKDIEEIKRIIISDRHLLSIKIQETENSNLQRDFYYRLPIFAGNQALDRIRNLPGVSSVSLHPGDENDVKLSVSMDPRYSISGMRRRLAKVDEVIESLLS